MSDLIQEAPLITDRNGLFLGYEVDMDRCQLLCFTSHGPGHPC